MERAELDWGNLGFGVVPTDFNIVYRWSNGTWSQPDIRSVAELTLPLAATALHYGQALFEGLKAFETVDGRVVVFRAEQNAERLARGARKLLMAAPTTEIFMEGVTECVRRNLRFVPPADSGAALYIRPLLLGAGGRLGVRPAEEYLFCVFVTPVGPYFKSELTPIKLTVEEEVHRAAPLGVGDIKAAGNYAAGMRAVARAKERGFDNVVYLDARTGRYVDETGATNFFGIKHQGDTAVYVTPHSLSILPSITNNSLMTLARDMGLKVERRPIEVSELEDFDEVGCCGTAAVITPVETIEWRGKSLDYGSTAGPWTRKLYDALTKMQRGAVDDRYGWLTEVA